MPTVEARNDGRAPDPRRGRTDRRLLLYRDEAAMTEKATDMDPDLRGRVVALEQGQAANGQRLTTLEAWRTQRDIDSARHDERWKRMDDKIDAVGKKVDKISEGLSRIMWMVVTGIVVAVVGFMIKGGFAP